MNWSAFLANPWTITIGSGLVVVAVSARFKAGRQFWRKFWAFLRSKPFVPTETLRIVQDIRQSFWSLGSSDGVPSMNVVFEGHVTNISNRPSKILRAEIPKPPTISTMMMLCDDHVARRHGDGLLPFESADIHAMFFVQAVVAEAGKPWKTTLIFVDQYNNRHKIKNCVFRGLPPPPKQNTVGS